MLVWAAGAAHELPGWRPAAFKKMDGGVCSNLHQLAWLFCCSIAPVPALVVAALCLAKFTSLLLKALGQPFNMWKGGVRQKLGLHLRACAVGEPAADCDSQAAEALPVEPETAPDPPGGHGAASQIVLVPVLVSG